RISPARGIVAPVHLYLGRAGLAVPAHEGREIASALFGKALDELLDRRRLAVVTREIEVHAGAEIFLAEQRLQHADNFGALLVYRAGVEVIDFLVEFRPHWMRQGTGILDELRRAQIAHVGDALDRPRAHVAGEFLVAEDGEPLLQTK